MGTIGSSVQRFRVTAMPCLCCLVAACGTGSATYRGTVTAAESAGYSFEVPPSTLSTQPVAGATVKLAAMHPGDDCATLWPMQLPSGTARSHPQATTDANGRYEVVTYYPGFVGDRVAFVVCVRREGFEPFQYIAIEGKTKDPVYGEQPLDIRLKRVTPAK